jgi:hypothetical protein
MDYEKAWKHLKSHVEAWIDMNQQIPVCMVRDKMRELETVKA